MTGNVNEDYEKYLEDEKKRQGKWSRLSRQVKPLHLIIFFLLLGFLSYGYNTGKVSKEYIIATIIGFIILIAYMSTRVTEKTLLPEHVIKQIAYDALEKKRRLGIEIPFDWKVRVMLVGESCYEQDLQTKTSGVIKREVGFEISKKSYRKTGVIGIHPYSGAIIGIREEKTGYTGKETKDKQIIPIGVADSFRMPSEHAIG